MSNEQQRRSARAGRVSFDEIKFAFPLRDVLSREFGGNFGRQGQTMFRCPLHEDTSPSLSIKNRNGIEVFKCHSGQCGQSGTVLDVVWTLHPELRNNAAATLAYLNQLTGRAVEALQESPRGRNTPPLATEQTEAGGTEVERVRAKRISMDEVRGRHNLLLTGAALSEAREYARERGWLRGESEVHGAYPYPVGVNRWPKGWLGQFQVPALPKLIRTRRGAFLCGREKEFESERELCLGYKLRLTPQVHQAYWNFRIERNGDVPREELEPNRFWCLPDYVMAPPGEVDDHEDAEVLVIVEGPGKGIHLYHEAHSTPNAATRFGTRWHIVFEDNAGTWTPASLERRCERNAVGDGKVKLQSVSHFDGFRLIIVLFDSDEAGRDAANMVEWHAHRQAPNTPVKKVKLPDGDDVDDFFLNYTIYDLGDLIAQTEATRGRDFINCPPPLNAAQRKRLAAEQQRSLSGSLAA